MLTDDELRAILQPLIEAGTTVETFTESYRQALADEAEAGRRIDVADALAALREIPYSIALDSNT